MVGRANIRGKDKDVITDDGAVIISIAQGEQRHIQVQPAWITSLTGYTISAQAVEAANASGDTITVPLAEADNPTITPLVIIDDDPSDNLFKVVLPASLADNYAVQPTPDDPVYAFFAYSLADTGSGNGQQIFVPVRGVIEIRYNPLETTA